MKTMQKFALNSAQCCRISLIPEQDALSVVGKRVDPSSSIAHPRSAMAHDK